VVSAIARRLRAGRGAHHHSDSHRSATARLPARPSVASISMKLGTSPSFVKSVSYTELWDQLLAEGRSSFTVAELEACTGATANAIHGAVKYATDRHRLFSPVRGLYVVVPPEHRPSGVLPTTHFIDPMMNHLGVDYYMAFASAAQWWGAAHQAPQAFDVVTSRHVLDRLRLRFHSSTRFDTDEVRRVSPTRPTGEVSPGWIRGPCRRRRLSGIDQVVSTSARPSLCRPDRASDKDRSIVLETQRTAPTCTRTAGSS
jgi:hypothetical protein